MKGYANRDLLIPGKIEDHNGYENFVPRSNIKEQFKDTSSLKII
jgi:hypothetical protein